MKNKKGALDPYGVSIYNRVDRLDENGEPCTLEELCSRRPSWAASVIRWHEKQQRMSRLIEVPLDRMDEDGKPCTLDHLCRVDPTWAADVIRLYERQQRELVKKVELLEEEVERLRANQTTFSNTASPLSEISYERSKRAMKELIQDLKEMDDWEEPDFGDVHDEMKRR